MGYVPKGLESPWVIRALSGSYLEATKCLTYIENSRTLRKRIQENRHQENLNPSTHGGYEISTVFPEPYCTVGFYKQTRCWSSFGDLGNWKEIHNLRSKNTTLHGLIGARHTCIIEDPWEDMSGIIGRNKEKKKTGVSEPPLSSRPYRIDSSPPTP